MGELNQLLYNQIKDDTSYKALTGATASDPRIYKDYTPVRNPITDLKQGYSVYHVAGTIDPGLRVDDVGRNDTQYVTESYAVTDTLLDDMTERIERLFEYRQFETTSYYIGQTKAHKGSSSFDEGRQLYFQTVTILFRLVRAKTA